MLAFCARLNLTASAFERAYETPLLRVRMQEIKGSELLVAAGGALRADMFTDQGQRFLAQNYSRYLTLLEQRYGASLDGLEDSWSHYEDLAREMTGWLLTKPRRSAPDLAGYTFSGLKQRILKWLKTN